MTDKSGSILYRYAPAHPVARLLCTAILILLILAGITALILYLVYRPSKPRFTVLGAAIYELGTAKNANAPNPAATAISTSMQFTVLFRNPSERATVRYDRLSAYVSYRGQAITPPQPLPGLFLERDSSVAVSPVLGGSFVPVSAEVCTGLLTDEAYGVVALRLVLMGRLKYKSGPFRSAWYGMYVRCDVLVGVKKGSAGQVPLLGTPDCDTDI